MQYLILYAIMHTFVMYLQQQRKQRKMIVPLLPTDSEIAAAGYKVVRELYTTDLSLAYDLNWEGEMGEFKKDETIALKDTQIDFYVVGHGYRNPSRGYEEAYCAGLVITNICDEDGASIKMTVSATVMIEGLLKNIISFT